MGGTWTRVVPEGKVARTPINFIFRICPSFQRVSGLCNAIKSARVKRRARIINKRNICLAEYNKVTSVIHLCLAFILKAVIFNLY